MLPGFAHPQIDQRRVEESAVQQDAEAAYQGDYAGELGPRPRLYLPNPADASELAAAT